MKLSLKRIHFLDTCTIGTILIDGVQTPWFTLEPMLREVVGQPVESWKILGCTAIPVGKYQVVLDYSQHFQMFLPHLLNVPGFEGVRIHCGNTKKDTEGCILVGSQWNGRDAVLNSRTAFEDLMDKIQTADYLEIEIT